MFPDTLDADETAVRRNLTKTGVERRGQFYYGQRVFIIKDAANEWDGQTGTVVEYDTVEDKWRLWMDGGPENEARERMVRTLNIEPAGLSQDQVVPDSPPQNRPRTHHEHLACLAGVGNNGKQSMSNVKKGRRERVLMLSVQNQSGDLVLGPTTVLSTTPVQDLQRLVAAVAGQPASDVHLLHGAQEITTSGSISDACVADGAVLNYIVMPPVVWRLWHRNFTSKDLCHAKRCKCAFCSVPQ